jgi:WD40 repeat protein
MVQRLAVLAALLTGAALFAQPDEDDEPDPKTIERLVKDLGSEDFRAREAATIALRKIGDLAIPQLRRREQSGDVEASRRARDLLRDFEIKGQVLRCTGHEQGIIALALLANDKKALSAGQDKNICLWDLDDGKLLRRFDGHAKEVWALAVAPDGKSFASSGQDCTIRLWDLEGDATSRKLATLPDCVRALRASVDGKRLFAACFDKNIHVVNIETGKTEAVWDGHKDAVHCLAVSADGAQLLSGGGYSDAAVCLRDAVTGKILHRLVGHQERVFAVAFVGEDRAVSAGADNTIRLWDLKTGKGVREFKGHEKGVNGLAVSRDRKRLLSGGGDRRLRLWDISTGDELRHYHDHEGSINALAFTANARFAVSAGSDCTLRLWQLPRAPKK